VDEGEAEAQERQEATAEVVTHAEAAEILRRTGPDWAGPRARRLVQAVALHETSYGRGWRNCAGMEASHNWGAIQGAPGVLCEDTHADGSTYRASYRIYPSDEAGAAGLWYELTKRPLVVRVLRDDSLDVAGLAHAMRTPQRLADGRTFGPYYEATEQSYVKALRRALDSIARGA